MKASQTRRLENLYRRRVPVEYLVTPELARDLAAISHEIRRQVGLLIDRSGKVVFVLAGDHRGIVIPDLSAWRGAAGRLKGLRCVHTHLNGEPLTADDLTDLAMLRLDLMAAVQVDGRGRLERIHAAHLLPHSQQGQPHRILAPLTTGELDIGCRRLVRALESELDTLGRTGRVADGKEHALLVNVTTTGRRRALESLAELRKLTFSSGIDVADTIVQKRRRADSRYLVGPGKLQEIALRALQKGATLTIFDQELNPSQIKSITDRLDLKVIDRTQLILDIFAQRAQSREGKLQVELAQLRYLLPRLVTRNTAMSRLTGGIGGRGPGETKLEINRRRVHARIRNLERSVARVGHHRRRQRARRDKRDLPVVSIIGYTNAGKSTLLNTLTHSRVRAENRLFATLDPSSRRLRFPRDIEVIITDTVGFIRNLPRELMAAFRATLEELQRADVLLHVIDISHPLWREHLETVENILADLGLAAVPLVRVLNKRDLVASERIEEYCRELGAVSICARDRTTLRPLVTRLHERVRKTNPARS